jgi:two-component system, LuxR family, sensor kinase FixL
VHLKIIKTLSNTDPLYQQDARLLNAIFENAIDGIITINRQAIVQTINPAAARLFGYKPDEVIGQNVNLLMPEPFHAEHDKYMQRYHETGEKRIIGIGRTVQGRKKDGTCFPFHLGVSEVVTENAVFYTGFIHDLTERTSRENEIKELNLSLERKVTDRTEELSDTVNKLLSLNKKLEFEVKEREKIEATLRQTELEIMEALKAEKEHNELKSRFVSMASHEFRTPLSTILSSVALIARYTQTEQQEQRNKHIVRIKSAVSNLTAILNDFLSLSKLEEGKLDAMPIEFYMDDLCREVMEDMRGLLKPGQQFVHSSLNTEQSVFLDVHLLKNVLFNLISNAIKYSDENKNIYCNVAIENKQLVISIKDEGIGIPDKDQEHLFSRFFRATNVTNIQGTGLGLNIVMKYLELLNGKIDFRSEEGKGSTFWVKFDL